MNTARDDHPDRPTLLKWMARWNAIRSQAYQELIASYTPEQRELARRIVEASGQARLCAQRAKWPEGATGKHQSLIRWPQEPPEDRSQLA